VSWRTGSKPRNTELANGTLAACQVAAGDADLDSFTTMASLTPLPAYTDTSNNRRKEYHATVRVKTIVQSTINKHQVAHIYIDKVATQVQQPTAQPRR
ncbi:hypothetical protein B0H67DRAFT_479622, partial [Lasiosphaeris hirsuta]